MLQIKEISKQYVTGDFHQAALDKVSLNLRDNEFVSILGPSGSGKTTLLNIIGGLDRYDSGDLVINGISTKKYKDRDWDSYRNHTIGFVFQSYNLIPHQSILANVELALTISGISRGERRKRAKQALEEVGLGNQLHKKPNQMSGGQMQRVAIARALVNDPDILLADEPTGALDTETSIQVMELLKKVADKRLVVMVTHNPELAEQYSTRIVKLRDGKIIGDSDPYTPDTAGLKEPEHKNMGKAKMSFLTSLSLSFNNLRTKKGRTLLTAFAGSIGIIGIALILALSTGVNDYIGNIQKETMTSYPITINAETIDMSSMRDTVGQMRGERNKTEDEERTGVYMDYSRVKAADTMVTANNLTAFKKYLDDPDSDIQQYLGENGVVYTYDISFGAYAYDSEGKLVNTDASIDTGTGSPLGGKFGGMGGGMMGSVMGGSSGSGNFSELMAGIGGQTVSQTITDSYELLYGAWPENYDEVILVLDSRNALSAQTLYQLGFITADEYKELSDKIANEEEIPEYTWNYKEVCDHTFYLIPSCDYYVQNDDGTFTYVGDNDLAAEQLLENSVELKITGVIRPTEDAKNAGISTAVAYTTRLSDYVIEYTDASEVIKAQEANPEINVLNGMSFTALDDAAKVEDTKLYISEMSVSDKASLYQMIMYFSAQNAENSQTGEAEQQPGMSGPGMSGQMGQAGQMGGAQMDETTLAAALDKWVAETPDEEILLMIYDQAIGGATYGDNLKDFGKVSYDAPSSINIYTDSFEAKEAVADCIEAYNETVDEDEVITYIDLVEMMTSSLTTIINVISGVLVAFVAVSLIVSCIMIGIITHISVLERTKEIGILRALGASKGNISQVFNAETFIIGFCSGLLGVGVSALLTIPINAVIQHLLGDTSVAATLPIVYAVLLVILSMVITVIGGLLPARSAAKKDPVVALRTE